MNNKFRKLLPNFFQKDRVIDPQSKRSYWRRLMHSTQVSMSHGANNVFKIISWARNENWRRKEPKK